MSTAFHTEVLASAYCTYSLIRTWSTYWYQDRTHNNILAYQHT